MDAQIADIGNLAEGLVPGDLAAEGRAAHPLKLLELQRALHRFDESRDAFFEAAQVQGVGLFVLVSAPTPQVHQGIRAAAFELGANHRAVPAADRLLLHPNPEHVSVDVQIAGLNPLHPLRDLRAIE